MASFIRGCLDAAIDEEKRVTGVAAARAAVATPYGSDRSSLVLVAVPAFAVVDIAMFEALVFAEGVRFRASLSIETSFRQRWAIYSWMEFQGSSLWHFVLLLLLVCFNPLALVFLWYGSVFERSTKLCMLEKIIAFFPPTRSRVAIIFLHFVPPLFISKIIVQRDKKQCQNNKNDVIPK